MKNIIEDIKVLHNIVFAFLILLSLILLKPDYIGEMDSILNIVIISITIFNIVFFLINTKRILRNWVNFHTLFIVGFIIVHFQIIFLDSLGIPPSNPSFIWINKSIVNYANWISCMAITVYTLFGLFSFFKFNTIKERKSPSFKIVKTKKIDVFIIILFVIFIFLVGEAFLSGEYDGGANWGEGASYILLLLRSILVIRLIYLFNNYNQLRERNGSHSFFKYIGKNKVLLIVLFLFLLIFANSGDRGPIIEFALIFIYLFSLKVKRIKIRQLILMIIIGSLFLTILREGRAIKDSSDNIFNRGVHNIRDKEFFGFTEELASSVRILFRAVDVFPPHSDDLLYGKTMAINLSSSIPFLTNYIIVNNNIPLELRSSTYFFTIVGQGKNFTYGEGSEIIGDIYINFGYEGVLIIFAIFGMLITRVSVKVEYSNNYLALIVIVVYVSTSIYLNRSVFFYPLQLLSITIILDYIFRKKLS